MARKEIQSKEFEDFKKYIEQRLDEQARETRESFLGAMAALSFAYEANDVYTAGHSGRVTELALNLANRLGIGADDMENLRWGSLLHDIGKITVNRLIINQPRKLTDDEYTHVMTHPKTGAKIVGSVINNKKIIQTIEYHHAHYDGNGYEQILKHEEIPLLARIVAVVDAYDAISSKRPYRDALSDESALAEIKWGMGKQFDPAVSQVFLEMMTSLTSQKKKILIADDEANIRELISKTISQDYSVIEANDGQMALELSQSQHPSLIFLDILMPKKDGLRTCYELKTGAKTKEIPVILLTTNEDQNQILIKDLGADKCITKPLTPHDIHNTINQFLKVTSK